MAPSSDHPLSAPYLRFHAHPTEGSGRAPVSAGDGDDGQGARRAGQEEEGEEQEEMRGSHRRPAVPRMPTADELSVAPLPDSFRCPLCLDILDQPMITVPCGHTFCEMCIRRCIQEEQEANTRRSSSQGTTAPDDSHPSSSPTSRPMSPGNGGHCPVCRGPVHVDNLAPCWIVRELIDNIIIRCDYGVSFNFESQAYEAGVPGGCPAIFRLSERPAHLLDCPYVMVACRFAGDGCSAILRRSEVAAHEEDCEFQATSCSLCGERVPLRMLDEHSSICSRAQVVCVHKNRGCEAEMQRRELRRHLEVCPYEAVRALLDDNEREIATLRRKNLQLESSLWTALKGKQQLEQELKHVRMQLQATTNRLRSAANQLSSSHSRYRGGEGERERDEGSQGTSPPRYMSATLSLTAPSTLEHLLELRGREDGEFDASAALADLENMTASQRRARPEFSRSCTVSPQRSPTSTSPHSWNDQYTALVPPLDVLRAFSPSISPRMDGLDDTISSPTMFSSVLRRPATSESSNAQRVESLRCGISSAGGRRDPNSPTHDVLRSAAFAAAAAASGLTDSPSTVSFTVGATYSTGSSTAMDGGSSNNSSSGPFSALVSPRAPPHDVDTFTRSRSSRFYESPLPPQTVQRSRSRPNSPSITGRTSPVRPNPQPLDSSHAP